MPERHDVRPEDIVARRLHANLAAAADRGPKDFAELLLVPGVGARTVRALAQVAEVVHGAPYRFSDPARFSLAHGGKDRHPYPVPLKVYDRTIEVMKAAVRKAKLGQSEELAAIRRLDDEARRLEAEARGPSVEALFAEERARSYAFRRHERVRSRARRPEATNRLRGRQRMTERAARVRLDQLPAATVGRPTRGAHAQADSLPADPMPRGMHAKSAAGALQPA